MRILNWLIEKRRERRWRNLARSIACEAFGRAYPDESIEWALNPQKNIVCVCYNEARPPCRTWWLIDEEKETARELSFEEASKIIPIAMWR